MPRSFALIAGLGAALLALLPATLAAQETVPGGRSLLAWLGHEPGDRRTYAGPEGERVCVGVRGPANLGGRRYATLLGMPWPGLASDGQVFLPLDGPRRTAGPDLPSRVLTCGGP